MNFYDILGVDPEADRSEIRTAYRSLARRYHPDVNDHPDASDQFKVLSRARDVLTDETERSAYDRLGHADYVSKRLEGALPDVEMDPQLEDDADSEAVADADSDATTGAVADTDSEADTDAGAEDAATADTDTGADTGATADDASTADSDAGAGAATGGAPSGATSEDPGAGSSDGRGADTDTGTAGGSTGGPDSSAGDSSTERTHADARTGAGTGQGIDAGSAGPSPNDATTTGGTSQGSADTESPDTDTDTGDGVPSGSPDRRTADAATTGDPAGGTAEDAEPSTTATGGTEGATEGEKSYSTPPTPGGPSGPERLRNDRTRTSRRLGSPLATLRAHFGASHRWLVVVAAAGVYGAGLAGYLLATAGTLGTLWSDLTSGDLAAMTGAIAGTDYEVPGLLEYGLGGFGGAQPLGPLSLLGAVALPVALVIAVYGLRRRATWRPSWLHVLGALGPLASVGLDLVGAIPRVPVLVDILLLVVFPAAVAASFLLNRLVLVAPLRRREDLGLP